MAQRLSSALAGDPVGLGERLTRAYLNLWEDPDSAGSILAMVRSAIASDRAADRLRALLGGQLHAQAPVLLGRPDGLVRAGLVGSHLVGVAIARYVMRVEPSAGLDLDVLVAACAPAIQRYLTDPLPTIDPPTRSITE